MEEQKQFLDVSWATIFKISGTVIAFFVLSQIRDLLMWFVFAVIISLLFEPAIEFLRKLRVPRVVAVCSLYFVFFGVLSLIVYLTVPMFVSELKEFSALLPGYFERISPSLKWLGVTAFEDLDTAVKTLEKALNQMTASILNGLFVLFGGIFTTLFVLTLSVFIALEEKAVEKNLLLFAPAKYEGMVISIWRKCQKRISNWFLVRLFACAFVGLASYFAFLIFRIQYPFTLGLVAGALNFIPVVGPVVTGLLLFVTIGLNNLLKAVLLVVVFTLIQQIENNILTPLLSKKLINLSPVLVLMALVIGGTLWGFLGSVLATPLLGILFEFLKDFLKEKKEKEAAAAQP